MQLFVPLLRLIVKINKNKAINRKIVIQLKDINKTYNNGAPLHVLKGINLDIQKGEFVSIMGASGSGKSTLLNIIGGIDRADAGSITINGEKTEDMNEKRLTAYRRKHLGYIFQMYNLIPNLTAVENVELPLIYRGVSRSVRQELSREALKKVGLEHRMDHKPSEMSGGQQQRVAIARAIAQAPPVILADEPTGNLDSNSTKEIMDILKGLHKEGRTVILITHDNEIAAQAKRVIKIKDGKVESDSGQIVPVEELQTAGA